MNIFEKQVSAEAIEQGVWFQPEYPTGPKAGDPMVNDVGDPIRLRVRSTASQAFRDLERQRQRKNVGHMVGGAGKRSEKKIVNETTKDKTAEDFSVLVTGLENVDGPGITTPTPADLLEFCADKHGEGWQVRSGMIWLVGAVKAFADNDENYPGVAGNGSTNGA